MENVDEEMAEYLSYDWRNTHILAEDQNISQFSKNQQINETLSLEKLRSHILKCEEIDLKSVGLNLDDNTLKKFLYARKFVNDETLELLRNYCWYRKKNPLIFTNLTCEAPDILKCLENGLPGVLSSKDRKGHCVLILNSSNWDCTYTLFSIYRALLVTLEFLIEDIHNQSRGFVVIVDWTDFTFRQSTNLKPSVLKLMIDGLQDCFPARFKGIHFVNQPWFVEAALTLIKTILKEKIKERIFVHGNNLSTLHDLVHKDILPTELGGEKPSYNPEIWLKKIREDSKK